MKCQNCGSNNPGESKYCSNCGERLNSELTCGNCGKTLKPGSNFCNYCGTKIKAGKASAARAVKTSSGNKRNQASVKRGKTKKSKKKNVMSYAPVIIVLVIIGGILITILSLSPGSRNSSSRKGEVVLESNEVWDAEVLAIAANFNCPCGECGITPLDMCTCDASRGAVEVKTYIRSLLDQGLSKYEIVKLVEDKYGNRR